jgi:glycerol-3-phosphate dehydrogenase
MRDIKQSIATVWLNVSMESRSEDEKWLTQTITMSSSSAVARPGRHRPRLCIARLRVVLLERHDIATGATGRNHGLLHSGARYAVTDNESARECIAENQILKRIARHCIEPTDGLFITLPEDDLAYQPVFIDACQRAGINAQAITPEEARRMEPSVNPALTGAVRVPDGTVDPFRLTASNMLDAREHGATILTGHEVCGLVRQGDRVTGVQLMNPQTHEIYPCMLLSWSMPPGSGASASRSMRIYVFACSRPKAPC